MEYKKDKNGYWWKIQGGKYTKTKTLSLKKNKPNVRNMVDNEIKKETL